MTGYPTNYNDEWIRENYLSYPSYKELVAEYNNIFSTNLKLAAFKNHCRYKLNLVKPRKKCRHYTEEQVNWLKENYPKYGCSKTLSMFNKKFNETRSYSSMKNFGQQYGIKVDKNVAINNKVTNGGKPKRNIGDIRKECGRYVIKTENGWEFLSKNVYEKHYGQVPDGYLIKYLDNNPENNNIENLVAIPRSYIGLLSKYSLQSEFPEVTKTGIKWCDLYTLLKKEKLNASLEVI